MPYRLDTKMNTVKCSRKAFKDYYQQTQRILLRNTHNYTYTYGKYAKMSILYNGINKKSLFTIVLFTYLPDEKITIHGNFKSFQKVCAEIELYNSLISKVYRFYSKPQLALDLEHLYPFD